MDTKIYWSRYDWVRGPQGIVQETGKKMTSKKVSWILQSKRISQSSQEIQTEF